MTLSFHCPCPPEVELRMIPMMRIWRFAGLIQCDADGGEMSQTLDDDVHVCYTRKIQINYVL